MFLGSGAEGASRCSQGPSRAPSEAECCPKLLKKYVPNSIYFTLFVYFVIVSSRIFSGSGPRLGGKPEVGVSWVPLGASWMALVPPSSVIGPGCSPKGCQNNCKMFFKMEATWTHKCAKCDESVKQILKKAGPGNMHVKMSKQVETQALQSLIFEPILKQNRILHFSRFAQKVCKFVPKGLRN